MLRLTERRIVKETGTKKSGESVKAKKQPCGRSPRFLVLVTNGV